MKISAFILAVFIALLFMSTIFNTEEIHHSECSHTPISSLLTDNQSIEAADKPICKDYLDYAPSLKYTDHTPMRYYKINVHIMKSKDGSTNFDEVLGKKYVERVVRIANYKLRNNKQMKLPEGNNTPVIPTQFQYVLTGQEGDSSDDGIYFHYDDETAYFNKKGKPYSTFDKTQYERYGIGKEEIQNVFLVEHHPDSIASSTYKPSADGVGMRHWAKLASAYHHMSVEARNNKDPFELSASVFAGLFNHELGHSLGLNHTWSTNDGCDDTPKNSNCWSGPACSNNVMDYNNTNSAYSPCQIGKVHYNFSKTKSAQRKKLVRDWCEKDPKSTITIGRKERVHWNASKDLRGDIIIEKGGELKISCTLNMPSNSCITVEPGGVLVLDGCTIANDCGATWRGIKLPSKGKKKGKVIEENEANIQNVSQSMMGSFKLK